MPILDDGRPGYGVGRSPSRRESSNHVELSLLPRAEGYRANAMAEPHAGRPDRATRNLMRTTEDDPTSCGNPVCRLGWIVPWKSRRHPFFEERWACSSRCLLAMVEAAIGREAGNGHREPGASEKVQHQHRVPLGLVLLHQGWITHPQLQRALQAQKDEGSGRIGDWLVSECGLDPRTVTRGLSVQWSCPVLTTDGFSPASMAMSLPRAFVEQFGILPIRLAGSRILYAGFEDHLDASSAFAIERMTGLRTESGVVAADTFAEARERLLKCNFARLTECRVSDRDMLAKAVATVLEQKRVVYSRLVRLHQYYWLRTWTGGKRYLLAGNLPASLDSVEDHLFTSGRLA